jgi:[ribosomal protein S18]-alanine N-acetyltransferase
MPDFAVRGMGEDDARAVATWRYSGEYSFYDADADADDLAELLDPDEWGRRYFAVDGAEGQLVGFLVIKLDGDIAELGLGLRPDLTGRGLGASFVETGVRYAADRFAVTQVVLAVAAFNRRALTVYERVGFRKVERYDHATNGGIYPFIRLRARVGRPG